MVKLMLDSSSSQIRVFRVELTPTAKVGGHIIAKLVAAPVNIRGLASERVEVPDWEKKEYSLVEFGQMMFGLAFPGGIREKLTESRQKPGLLRLIIDAQIPRGMSDDINCLPWELLHDGQGWLAHDPNLSIARDPFGQEERRPSQPIGFPLRVLSLSAEPRSDFTPLFGANKHLELVKDQITRAAHDIQIETIPGATREKLRKSLNDYKPHVVHYIGHAALTPDRSQGYMELELPAQQDEPAMLTAAEFKDWLQALGDAVPKLIVFMACNSGLPSRAGFLDLARASLDAGVDATVSMQAPLLANEALELTRTFFSELVHLKGLDEALRLARMNAPVFEVSRAVYFPGRLRPTSPFLVIHRHGETRVRPLADIPGGEAVSLPAWMVPVLHVRGDADLSLPTPPLSITWPKDGQKMVYVPEAGMYVDSFPVTRGQYRRFAQTARRRYRFRQHDDEMLARLHKHLDLSDSMLISDDLLPATSVSLGDAQAYAEWAGKHIPTLKEWRQVAEAGGDPNRQRPWLDGDHPERINCREQGLHMVWPAVAAEHFGNRCPAVDIFDLVGNVAEWAYNPLRQQAYRCGGSFKDPANLCMIRRAEPVDGDNTNDGVGFRCVASIDEYITISDKSR